jgi:hypothetical protein
VNSVERRIKFLPHLVERQQQRRAPSDQHIIVAGMQLAVSR